MEAVLAILSLLCRDHIVYFLLLSLPVSPGYQGTADFDPSSSTSFNLVCGGGACGFLVKLDPIGDLIWAFSYEGSAKPDFIVVDSSGTRKSAGALSRFHLLLLQMLFM